MKSDRKIQGAIVAPGSSVLSDGDLVLAVRCILQWQASLPLGAVKVRVMHGWVSIHGEVKCDFPRQRISAAVRLLAGVRGLHDHVVAKSLETAAPALPIVLHWQQSELLRHEARSAATVR